jgi:fructuronate reductase
VPDFAALGVTVTSDVAAFERAKLRILNGAHSTLAYLGLLRGFVTVGEAIADPELARHVSSMLSEEVLPGLDGRLGDYTAATLRRFRNRELRHELAQIAWDGSQKLPYRILETIAENLEAGRSITRLAATLAAWLLFLRRAALQHRTLVDPLAPSLLELGSKCSGEPGADVARLLALREVFPAALASDPRLARAIEAAYRRLCSEGAILLT